MNGKRSLVLGAVIGLSAALAACGGGSPSQSGTLTKVGGNATSTLKATLGTVNGAGDDELNFADAVKRLSTGAIDVTVTDQWRSGDPDSEAGLVNDVVDGKAELGLIGARGFDTAGVNSFAGLQTPMLIDSYDLEAKVLATDWATKLLQGPRSIGIVGLGYVQGELRQALGITRDLAQVSDFQGARIGIRPSHVTEMTMKALGATTSHTPVPVNLSGLDGMAKDPGTKATIDAITALRGPTDAPDVLAPCPEASESTGPNNGPTALDGTWTTSYTKAELISSPFLDDPGSINDVNWGDFTLTFSNGRFSATQTNPTESSSNSGTFTVTGDIIYLADDESGETFVYRWSIYKNTLTFKRDNTLGAGPTPMLVKPWTRVY